MVTSITDEDTDEEDEDTADAPLWKYILASSDCLSKIELMRLNRIELEIVQPSFQSSGNFEAD